MTTTYTHPTPDPRIKPGSWWLGHYGDEWEKFVVIEQHEDMVGLANPKHLSCSREWRSLEWFAINKPRYIGQGKPRWWWPYIGPFRLFYLPYTYPQHQATPSQP